MWANFTYIGKETSYIRNLFRKTQVKIAFRTTYATVHLLSHKNPKPDIYSLSGIYKLTCPDCNKAYVGQVGRCFVTRFKEHEKAFRYNSQPSSFAIPLHEEAHSFETMNNIMQILHYHSKGTHLNTLEIFHIHAERTANNHINENQTIFVNAIFDSIRKTQNP